MARVELDGERETQRRLGMLGRRLTVEAGQAVRAAAAGILGDAVKSIQRGSKTGALYQKYKPRRKHRASAPGQAPASDTGRLAGSVQMHKVGLQADVGSNLDYAEYLEHGTRQMAARPWLNPAFRRWRKKFVKLLQIAIDNAGKYASR